MKIGILTQPLLRNYGCFLQNYALQKILLRLGNDVKTIDYIYPHTSLYTLFFSWMKTIGYYLIGKKTRRFARYQKADSRTQLVDTFVKKNLLTTNIVRTYSKKIIKTNNFDCIVVGSDQVWRPKYNRNLCDMFLNFTKNLSIKRIAYAASFGVDEWEFSTKQTKMCSSLAKKFDAISVREESGIKLCQDHLGVGATWVLDPTLLLQKEDYSELCKNIPIASENILVAYILDMNDAINELCESIAKEKKLTLKVYRAGNNATQTIPEWLAMFRDASYVVTDSFHGTVFSIIFEKDFKCLYNKNRGAARFESLLKLQKSEKIEEMRKFSINWLEKALET